MTGGIAASYPTPTPMIVFDEEALVDLQLQPYLMHAVVGHELGHFAGRVALKQRLRAFVTSLQAKALLAMLLLLDSAMLLAATGHLPLGLSGLATLPASLIFAGVLAAIVDVIPLCLAYLQAEELYADMVATRLSSVESMKDLMYRFWMAERDRWSETPWWHKLKISVGQFLGPATNVGRADPHPSPLVRLRLCTTDRATTELTRSQLFWQQHWRIWRWLWSCHGPAGYYLFRRYHKEDDPPHEIAPFLHKYQSE